MVPSIVGAKMYLEEILKMDSCSCEAINCTDDSVGKDTRSFLIQVENFKKFYLKKFSMWLYKIKRKIGHKTEYYLALESLIH